MTLYVHYAFSHSRIMSVEVTERDVKEIFGRKKFSTLMNVEIVPLSDDKIVGFLADHFILRITTEIGIHEYFLKAVPRNNEKRREYIEETGFFEREINIYQHFIPKLAKFSSFSWASKCFLVKNNHFIVLENLVDYKIVESQQLLLDYDHLKVCIKEILTGTFKYFLITDCIKIFGINARIFNYL